MAKRSFGTKRFSKQYFIAFAGLFHLYAVCIFLRDVFPRTSTISRYVVFFASFDLGVSSIVK